MLNDDDKDEFRKRPLRGYLKWELTAPRQTKTHSAKSALQALCDHLGYSKRIRLVRAVEFWEEVVGKPIADISEAISIKDGILKVKTNDPAWRQELNYMKRKIIRKLNKALGDDIVSDIKFS